MITKLLFQTELPQELRNTPIVLILETLNTSRSKDIPPDYSSVVQMKKQEEEDLPSYNQAVSLNTMDSIQTSIDNQFKSKKGILRIL